MNTKKQFNKGIVIILFAFFGIAQAEAQVTFRPGLRGGANFSHFTKGNNYDYSGSNSYIDFSSKTDFYVRFLWSIEII